MEDIGISIKFMGEKLDFDKNVSLMEKSINILKKDLKALNKELQLDPTNLTKISKKFENLKMQEKLARDVLKERLAYLKKLNDAEVSPFDKEYTDAEKKVTQAHDKLLQIQKQVKNITDTFAETNDETKTFSDRLQEAGGRAEDLANKLQPISSAAQGFLKGAVQSAIDFQDAFADVRKTVDETDTTTYDDLTDGLRQLAREVPATATELSHIAGLAGQMGVGADDVVKFTEAMVKFGDSTDISAEAATQDIAQIYNVIGKGGDYSSLDNLLSTIVELGNNTSTTESAIVEMFRNVAAGASRVGMTESQMAALAATLSSLGLDKGGASAISKVMTNIDRAVDGSTKDLAEWARVAGMSVEEFSNLWNSDASSGLLSVVQGIARMNDEGISMNNTLEDLGIKELRQIDTLSRLTNASDVYAENIRLANNAYDEASALNEEAAKRYATVASQIEILKNNFMEFSIAIGEILLPYVEYFIQSLSQLTDWLNNLQPHTKLLITRILAIVAALAPLLLGAGKILKLLGTIKDNVALLKGGIAALLKGIMALWNFLLPLVQTVIGWIGQYAIWIGIIYAFITAMKILYENCVPFREWVDGIIGRFKDLWEQFKQTNWIELLGEKFGWLGEIIGGLIELVKTLVSWFGNLISKALEFLGLKSSIESTAGSVGRRGNQITVLDSGGFSSGGFNSGGLISNPVFTFNVTSNNVTREDVRAWSSWIADDLNEELGRRIR